MQLIRRGLLTIKEYALIVFLAIFILTFGISQNSIPSDSMETTLSIGDRVIVSMIPYYYRSPQRYEAVAFDGPDGEKWIKRVIGLPGETIDIIDGNIYIDGNYLDESSYLVVLGNSTPDSRYDGVEFPYTIPEGTYFLLGDNRFASYDCRYIGAVREEEITGKAIYRIFPFNRLGSIQ